MDIKDFGVEFWMDKYETVCKYNLAETCVNSITIKQLKEITETEEDLLKTIEEMRLSYGEIPGNSNFRTGVSSLYEDVNIENILTTNGAIGANFLALYTLVEKDDEVVTVVPTYQQHYSIPESLGAKVRKLQLKKEESFIPNIHELKKLVNENTKLICLNSPNNPTGQIIPENVMEEIINIAKSVNAYVLNDEVYRHLNQNDQYTPSIVDLYEKGISTGSMSKVFSLAGLRLGWIVAPKEIIKKAYNIRHYSMISIGMIDEYVGSVALKNYKKLLDRNTKIIKENLKILDEFVENEQHINYVKPVAGTTALLYYDMDLSSTQLCDELMEAYGVMLVPGDCFDMGQCLRIGYAFNPQELKDGLKYFSKYLRKFD